MSSSRIDRIVIACMDRRLNEFLEKEYSDGRTIFLRNAGPDTARLLDTIMEVLGQRAEGGGPLKVEIVAHTNCGACEAASEAILDGKQFDPLIEKGIVDKFRGAGFTSRDELEKMNPGMQEADLKARLPSGIAVSSRLVDISSIKVPEMASGSHDLIVARASPERYSEMMSSASFNPYNTYITQGNSLEKLLPDIMVSLSLGVRRIAIFAEDGDFEKAKKWLNELKAQKFIDPDVKVSIAENSKQTRRVRA